MDILISNGVDEDMTTGHSVPEIALDLCGAGTSASNQDQPNTSLDEMAEEEVNGRPARAQGKKSGRKRAKSSSKQSERRASRDEETENKEENILRSLYEGQGQDHSVGQGIEDEDALL